MEAETLPQPEMKRTKISIVNSFAKNKCGVIWSTAQRSRITHVMQSEDVSTRGCGAAAGKHQSSAREGGSLAQITALGREAYCMPICFCLPTTSADRPDIWAGGVAVVSPFAR